MATVKGKWKFNETITIPSSRTPINFTVTRDDGTIKEYDKIAYVGANLAFYKGGSLVRAYISSSGWDKEYYRTVDFGETEQEVSDDFYTWLTANAAVVVPPAATIQHNNSTIAALYSGQTATLKCAGKLMKTDVVVTVYIPACETQFAGMIDGTATEITVPDGVVHIRKSAFQHCDQLVGISLPAGLTSIGEYAFYGCTNLALTSLPEGMVNIGEHAFFNCAQLALTSLPAGVESIGISTFVGCDNLALASLPAGLKSIGEYAFQYCPGLQTLTFEGTPTSIASTAFAGCDNLITINVPWAEGAVAGAPWGTNATINYNYTGA